MLRSGTTRLNTAVVQQLRRRLRHQQIVPYHQGGDVSFCNCPTNWQRYQSSQAASTPESNASSEAAEEDEEKLKPPWLQRKPWRWDPEDEDVSGLGVLTAPNVDVPEQYRTAVVSVTIVGAVVFFASYWWAPPSS
mmetsp:Transcript_63999/g.152608  ORF Transcript_63999/g.152608 Transcript_63999/m.152608 type:complete len:135 (+) Transcript_63999:94-498(+)